MFLKVREKSLWALLFGLPSKNNSVLVDMERQENASCCTVSKISLCPLLNLETVFSQWSSPNLRASSHRKAAVQVFAACVLTRCSTKPQMSLSSFGNFSASGAAMLRAPDCSSALGLYVPSVCLFFLTTQNNQTRKAETIASTPKVTVGATMAAMLGPCKQDNITLKV